MEERLARVMLSGTHNMRVLSAVREMGAVRALRHIDFEDPNLRDVERDERNAQHRRDPEAVLARAAEQGIRFIIPDDDEWPALAMRDLAGQYVGRTGEMPVGLWLQGPLNLRGLVELGSVAVVGTRTATRYGMQVAADIALAMAKVVRPVVSGLAYGIDVSAHRSVAAGHGLMVGVVAQGIDLDYPAAHDEITQHVRHRGLLVSEQPPGRHPTRHAFLARNRIIAALSRQMVVVEAAARGGSMQAAQWATTLGRDLCAVPGPVTSHASDGTNTLIRSGQARLVTNGEEVLG